MFEALSIDGDVYEVVPDEVRIAIEYLLKTKEKLGIPDDFELSNTTNKTVFGYILQVYKVWAALYPHEHREFIDNTQTELKYERPVKEAIKAGGYSPTSIPSRFDSLIRVLLPKVKTQDRRFWKPLFSSIPELRRSNFA